MVSVDGVIQDPRLESGSWESAYVEDQLQLFSALSTPVPRIVQGQRLVVTAAIPRTYNNVWQMLSAHIFVL